MFHIRRVPSFSFHGRRPLSAASSGWPIWPGSVVRPGSSNLAAAPAFPGGQYSNPYTHLQGKAR